MCVLKSFAQSTIIIEEVMMLDLSWQGIVYQLELSEFPETSLLLLDPIWLYIYLILTEPLCSFLPILT